MGQKSIMLSLSECFFRLWRLLVSSHTSSWQQVRIRQPEMQLRGVVTTVYFTGLYSYKLDWQLAKVCYSSTASWDSNLNRNQVMKRRKKPNQGSFPPALFPWLWASHPKFHSNSAVLLTLLPKPCQKHPCCTGAKMTDLNVAVVGKPRLVKQGVETGNHIIKILATAD